MIARQSICYDRIMPHSVENRGTKIKERFTHVLGLRVP